MVTSSKDLSAQSSKKAYRVGFAYVVSISDVLCNLKKGKKKSMKVIFEFESRAGFIRGKKVCQHKR